MKRKVKLQGMALALALTMINGNTVDTLAEINDIIEQDYTEQTYSLDIEDEDIEKAAETTEHQEIGSNILSFDNAESMINSNFDYSLQGDHINITNYKGSSLDVVVLPEYTINSKTYTTVITEEFFKKLNKDIVSLNVSGCDLSSVTSMNSMFNSCTSLQTVDFSNCNLSSVTDMDGMFLDCTSLQTVDFSNSDLSSVMYMTSMFAECTSLQTVDFSNCDLSSVTDMTNMFFNCTSLQILDFSNCDLSSITDIEVIFFNCISLQILDFSNSDLSSVRDIRFMFAHSKAITSVDFSGCDLSSVISMNSMFNDCTFLQTVDFSNCNLSSVTDVGSMLSICTSLTNVDFSNCNLSSVKNMTGMFQYCRALTSIDFSNCNLSSVTNMRRMFSDCTSLQTVDFSGFDLQSITNMNDMFNNCTSLQTVDFSDCDLSSVTDMSTMFRNCKALISIDFNNCNLSSVTNMKQMFSDCTSLTMINLPNLNLNNVTNLYYTFSECGISVNLPLIIILGKGELPKGVNLEEAFSYSTEQPKQLLIITDSKDIQGYDFEGNNARPLGIKFNAGNGGIFDNNTQYNYNYLPNIVADNKSVLLNYINDVINTAITPTKSEHYFIEWSIPINLTEDTPLIEIVNTILKEEVVAVYGANFVEDNKDPEDNDDTEDNKDPEDNDDTEDNKDPEDNDDTEDNKDPEDNDDTEDNKDPEDNDDTEGNKGQEDNKDQEENKVQENNNSTTGNGAIIGGSNSNIDTNTEEMDKEYPFDDVYENHWSYDQIEDLYNKGIIIGCNRLFRPNESITRAEFAIILNNICGYLGIDIPKQTDEKYVDVYGNRYYYSDIYEATSYDTMIGYNDGTFKPDNYITREEVIVSLSKLINICDIELEVYQQKDFIDYENISWWAKGYFDDLNNKGIITGDDIGYFNPQKNISRAETVVLLYKILNN